MTEQDSTTETEERTSVSAVSSQYRQAAGLPPRENDSPTDLADPAQLEKRYEPEGGYGGEGGIRNTSAINSSEQSRAEAQPGADEDGFGGDAPEPLSEEGLSGEETATQVAIVTGEDVTDVKPAPGTTSADDSTEE